MNTESKNRLEKKQIVNEIKNKMAAAQSVFLAEYRGLSVAQMSELRDKAIDMGVELKVFKNRLIKIAKSNKHSELDKYLTGPNIFVFSNENPVNGAKLLKEFAKDNKNLVIKAGIYEGAVVDQKGVLAVADLPSYEEALTMLASSLLGPLRQVSLSLKLIADENKLPA
ncbi:LSU ribosomal protein L10P [Mycoplasma testudineum]|uniref:Large ribosomal subunit protein uL10 n=1 Tax=Mycoplasma testudineum TaxID=244584 RepID=A0A4R6IEL6_9MOLU|nr:50S ribosomal protein L10 [Mycoplasma testudineum]OYD26933.1 50S ribosomal protein L10 [Mycoplasma testudineum]TDO20482.1 LSU ribosomal protein L10P [Mycoplasma testudineum]